MPALLKGFVVVLPLLLLLHVEGFNETTSGMRYISSVLNVALAFLFVMMEF